METNHSKYSPEDFWPQAEDMLNSHFSRKNKLRKFKIISLSIVLLAFTGIILYNLLPAKIENLSSESKPVSTSSSGIETPSFEIDSDGNKYTNTATNSTENNTLNDEEELGSAGSTNVTSNSDNEKNSANNTVQKNKLNLATEENSNLQNAQHFSNKNQNQTRQKSSGTISDKFVSNLPADGQTQAISNSKTTTSEVLLNKTEKPKTENKVTKEKNSEVAISGEAILGMSGKMGRQANTANSTLPAVSLKNNQTGRWNMEYLSTKKASDESIRLHFNDSPSLLTMNAIQGSFEMDSVFSSYPGAHQFKNKFTYRVQLSTGLIYSTSNTKAPDNYSFMRPSGKQWLAGHLQAVKLLIDFKNMEFGTGVEWVNYRLQNEINPVVWADQLLIQPNVVYFNDTSYFAQNNYYLGNQYTTEELLISNDSSIVNDSSLVKGWNPASLPDEYSRNFKVSYLEIPVQFSYRIKLNSRFNLAVGAGINIGFLQNASGFVPSADYSSWIQPDLLRKVNLSYRMGLQLAFSPTQRWEIALRPEYRRTNNIWMSQSSVSEWITGLSGSISVSYRLH